MFQQMMLHATQNPDGGVAAECGTDRGERIDEPFVLNPLSAADDGDSEKDGTRPMRRNIHHAMGPTQA